MKKKCFVWAIVGLTFGVTIIGCRIPSVDKRSEISSPNSVDVHTNVPSALPTAMTAREIVARAIGARGGRDAMLSSKYKEGWYESDLILPTVTSQRIPVRNFEKGRSFLTIIKPGGIETKLCAVESVGKGMTGWKVVSGIPLNLSAKERADYKDSIEIDEVLLLSAFDAGFTTKFVGEQQPSNSDSEVIVVNTPNKKQVTFSFDKSSGLISKIEATVFNVERGVDEVRTKTFLDWRSQGGHFVSYREKNLVDGEPDYTIQWDKIEAFDIPKKMFEKPQMPQSFAMNGGALSFSVLEDSERPLLSCSVGKNVTATGYFLVDTGAGLCTLNDEALKVLNTYSNHEDKIASEGSARVQGLGGMVDGSFIKMPEIVLTDKDANKQTMKINDLSGIVSGGKHFNGQLGTLGSNALSRFQVTFNFPKNTITFSPIGAKLPVGSRIPLEVTRTGIPYINIYVSGQSIPAWIDTGASFTSVPPRLVSQLAIKNTGQETIVVGVDGNRTKVEKGTLSSMKIGTHILSNCPVNYQVASSGRSFSEADSGFFRLGTDNLKNFVMTLNYQKGVAVFNKPEKQKKSKR